MTCPAVALADALVTVADLAGADVAAEAAAGDAVNAIAPVAEGVAVDIASASAEFVIETDSNAIIKKLIIKLETRCFNTLKLPIF
jgi:hypothetical protein